MQEVNLVTSLINMVKEVKCIIPNSEEHVVAIYMVEDVYFLYALEKDNEVIYNIHREYRAINEKPLTAREVISFFSNHRAYTKHQTKMLMTV